MPTTRKQKKTRASRVLEMLSDIENLDIMLGENHFDAVEIEESLNSNLARMPKSAHSNDVENDDENMYLNSGVINPGINADYGRNAASANFSAEIIRLSSELNSRIFKEIDEMMNSVSVEIQRAINDAISNQVLPQFQNTIMAGSGHMTKNEWNVPAERPEANSEVLRREKARIDVRIEHVLGRQNNDQPDYNAYDMVTGDNECPSQVSEFLTGGMPSRSQLNQSHEGLNPLFDTTIPAQKRIAPPAVESDPINRLADVLTSMQNRPTAQQLTTSPVHSNTMTFDGKNEKFEMFEDLFHTVMKMQPEMPEQTKINHFNSFLRKNALQTFHKH